MKENCERKSEYFVDDEPKVNYRAIAKAQHVWMKVFAREQHVWIKVFSRSS